MTSQPITALQEANRVRVVRARHREQVQAGHVDLSTLILDPPLELRTLQVGDAVMWQHRWGRSRMLQFLRRVRYRDVFMEVPENKTLGDLTTRQRVAVAMTLRELNASAAEREAA